MRQDSEHFGERELALIYIAAKLKEALALESLLTDAGVDYLVETDRYRGGLLFQTERVGVFFYVDMDSEGVARVLLESRGYKPYVHA